MKETKSFPFIHGIVATGSINYLFICFLPNYVMPLKSFVDDARKTNALIDRLKVDQKGSDEGIIDISEGQSVPKEKLEEIKNTNRSSLPSSFGQRAIPQRKDYTPFEREHIRRSQSREPMPNHSNGQQVDERHNNIITTIIKNSNTKNCGHTSWENCKHKKDTGDNVYCKEFMSLCGKEKCKRATE